MGTLLRTGPYSFRIWGNVRAVMNKEGVMGVTYPNTGDP